MKGIALVIGLDNYKNSDEYKPLKCAEHDAEEVAKALSDLKYEVECSTGDDDDTVAAYVGDFKEKLECGNYDVAIFYFAGHGEMINRYDCMMLQEAPSPTAHGGTPALNHTIKLKQLAEDMRAAGDQMNIIIMDACRKNRGVRGIDETKFGTMTTKLPYQTFLAFATSPETAALDGPEGGHSPYTKHLLSLINKENLPIEMLFKQVRQGLKSEGYDQLPWEHSCLINDFCFNHGQLSKYYEAPYREDSFKYESYTADTIIGTDALSLLLQDKETANAEAIKMIASGWREMSKDDLFVAGRLICNQAACGSKSCMDFLTDTSHQRLFNNSENNHLLNGYYYELYFDENDEVRTEILGDSNLSTVIEQLHMLIKNNKAEKFIKDMLDDYEHFYYVVGSTNEIPVHIESECLDYTDEGGYQLKHMSSIQIYGNDVIDDIDWEDEMLEEQKLRERIIESFALPRQLVRMKLPNEDITFIRYKLSNLAYDLQECMADYCPDEVSILSSHSYVEDVEDVCIRKITSTGNGIVVEGSCIVDVHMEYDHEDMGNMTSPCTFETEMDEDKEGNYRIDADTCKYKVYTDEYYK